MELFRALYELDIVSQDKHQHREQATALGGEGLLMNALLSCCSMLLAEYVRHKTQRNGPTNRRALAHQIFNKIFWLEVLNAQAGNYR
jgi:hypothetical protein